jgi:hypothetical protein
MRLCDGEVEKGSLKTNGSEMVGGRQDVDGWGWFERERERERAWGCFRTLEVLVCLCDSESQVLFVGCQSPAIVVHVCFGLVAWIWWGWSSWLFLDYPLFEYILIHPFCAELMVGKGLPAGKELGCSSNLS